MADKIVTEDPTNPGVLKVNGPTLGPGGKILLSDLDTSGAVNGNAIELVGGVWQPGSPPSSDTASNLGAGNGVFASKVGADFRFKSLIAGTGITITPTANDLTFTSTGAFSQQFVSTAQVITSGGSLTIAHGLGVKPVLTEIRLVNQIAELGYSPGDEAPHRWGMDGGGTSDQGLGVVVDATNVRVRYGAFANTMQIVNFTTGVTSAITNANWKIIVRAWA